MNLESELPESCQPVNKSISERLAEDPELRKRFEEAKRILVASVQEQVDAIEKSQRLTAEDFNLRVGE